MGEATAPALLVLHGLRIVGRADRERLSELTGLAPAVLDPVLDHLVDRDLVSNRPGRLGGHALTPAGRRAWDEARRAELADPVARSRVADAYERFLLLNPRLLVVCEDWQLRPVDGHVERNDHRDRAYDEAVIERLAALDGEVQVVCADLTSVLERFGRYGAAFARAVTRLRAGELEWLTKPLFPSYHTIWFELHEDLLATLGRERGTEPVS